MELVPTPIDKVQAVFSASITTKQKIVDTCLPQIVAIAESCTTSLRQGGKILLCGNGGSAADAQHLAAELLVRLRPHINRAPMAALALTTDSSSMTACGNDYGYEDYFERMVEALGKPGDVLIGISTSGRSKNVVRALRTARQRGVCTVGLLGGDGQPALSECEQALLVPSDETGRIQESHITIGHAIMELIEDAMLASLDNSIPLEPWERSDH